jgi:hypothetical protein
MPCIPLKVNRRFGGTLPSIFIVEDYEKKISASGKAERYVLPRHNTFTRLHGVTAQKTELFIVTVAITSNPTYLNSFS